MNRALLFLTFLWLAWPAEAAKRLRDFEKAPHNYWEHPPFDRFTQLKAALEGGRIPLDRASEKAFVTSLLKALDISCLLYTSPSPRDISGSRMPSSA